MVLILFPWFLLLAAFSLPQVVLHALHPRSCVASHEGIIWAWPCWSQRATKTSGELPAPVCSCCRAPSAQHYVKSETAVQGWVGNTEMKKTLHLSVVIGVVLAETEAAQGQTEEAQAQTEIDLRPRRARFGISFLGN